MESCHEENYVLQKQLENDKMHVTKKRKYENDTVTSNKSLKKVLKVSGKAPTNKPLKFTCDDCDFKTHGKRSLKDHMKTIHKNSI